MPRFFKKILVAYSIRKNAEKHKKTPYPRNESRDIYYTCFQYLDDPFVLHNAQ